MNPVFTLNYPELAVAEYLQKVFKKTAGYSVLIPLSGQQKGYDIALLRNDIDRESDHNRHPSAAAAAPPLCSKAATFQVKSSRTYPNEPKIAKRTGRQQFAHYLWLNTFAVPPEADFIILHGLYAPSPSSSRARTNVWKSYMLLFTNAEMRQLMPTLVKRTLNKQETHFGFGFNDESQSFLTRGHREIDHPDYSGHLLSKRQHLIEAALA